MRKTRMANKPDVYKISHLKMTSFAPFLKYQTYFIILILFYVKNDTSGAVKSENNIKLNKILCRKYKRSLGLNM